MKLEGTSAVITGAGNGIGRATALALARAGVNVAIADIEAEAAESVAGEVRDLGVRSLGMAVDVTGEAQIAQLAEAAWAEFGSVQILMNNAGVMPATGPLWERSQADFDWAFGVNVGGVLSGIRQFVPRFIESGEPCWVVNTGSEHSFGVPHLFGGVYTATKHAVLGLSDVLARELPDNVGVSVLCPGLVETSLWRASERRQDAFGGAAEASPAGAAAMTHGLSAEAVAECVLIGLQDETFFMLPHSHVVEIARERWENAERAFATQAPRTPGDDRYDVNKVIARLSGGES